MDQREEQPVTKRVYKMTSWFSIDSLIARARLAIILGDKVVKPIYIDWLGRLVIVMEENDPLPLYQSRLLHRTTAPSA